MYRIIETKTEKALRSKEVNYYFNKETGFMATWGKTKEDDPDFSPYGPFILDIEITSKCNGPSGKLCSFCYKSNNPNGHNMTLNVFKSVIDKMPDTLTQIALGADAQGITNPDMFDMMKYAREKGIIPNLTIADVSEDVASKLAKLAGAVAVSVYMHAGKDIAYDSIKRLSDAGMKQINIHFMLSAETKKFAFEVMNDSLTDSRLKNLNAIVFLSLKKKGRGEKFSTVNEFDYKEVVDYAFENKIRIGFDSCSAATFYKAVKTRPNYEDLIKFAEPCESTLFSSYINEYGVFFPCSFTENWEEGGWKEGLDVVNCNSFVNDIWNNEKTVKFRNNLIGNIDDNKCRNCPAFEVCGTFMKVI